MRKALISCCRDENNWPGVRVSRSLSRREYIVDADVQIFDNKDFATLF